MKRLRMHTFFLLLMCLLFSGCAHPNQQEGTTNGMEPIGLSNQVDIYQVARSDFARFLQDPSIGILANHSSAHYCYPQDGQWHFTYDIIQVPVGSQLLSFAGNVNSLQAFLNTHNVTSKIVNTLVIDAPRIPLTVWIETESDHYYITMTELYENMPKYQLYTAEEYKSVWGGKTGTLLVNKEKIDTDSAPILYHNYADIPFLSTLKALGAEIVYESDTKINIHIANNAYCLDLDNRTIFAAGQNERNLIQPLQGGTSFIYPVGKELMMDDTLMCVTLKNMGIDVAEIKCDQSDGSVCIRASS